MLLLEFAFVAVAACVAAGGFALPSQPESRLLRLLQAAFWPAWAVYMAGLVWRYIDGGDRTFGVTALAVASVVAWAGFGAARAWIRRMQAKAAWMREETARLQAEVAELRAARERAGLPQRRERGRMTWRE